MVANESANCLQAAQKLPSIPLACFNPARLMPKAAMLAVTHPAPCPPHNSADATPRDNNLHAVTANKRKATNAVGVVPASQQGAKASVSSRYIGFSNNTVLAMDWFMSGMSKGQQTHHTSQSPGQGTAPMSIPQLQGDPTFMYGGYGYRPPTLGYAWNGASQTTSMAQLPSTDSSSSTKAVTSPKSTLSKSVSAPDLQNPVALRELHKKKPLPQRQHSKLDGTPPPVPRHNRHLTVGHAPPGTPGESAANTPSSSRASTPPRRGAVVDSYWIGMAAA